MKAYKLEVIVVDFEGYGIDNAICQINNSLDYFGFNVINQQEADIGEWDDDHPLNLLDTPKEEKLKFFD